jgi:hypothetical protein
MADFARSLPSKNHVRFRLTRAARHDDQNVAFFPKPLALKWHDRRRSRSYRSEVQRRNDSGAQDMVAYQNQFRQAEAQFIADNRARAQQKIRDFETFRQRQREQKFWDERNEYVKRVTTPPKILKPEPRVPVPSHAAAVFVPDEGREDASSKDPARCFTASVEEFLARILRYPATGAMWAYIAIVVMPLLYASAFNRALISLGIGFGLSVNLVVWVTCGIEFLVLCRVGKWIATITASCMAWLLVFPLAFLEAGFDALFRRKSS